jgi:hypothetical protein
VLRKIIYQLVKDKMTKIDYTTNNAIIFGGNQGVIKLGVNTIANDGYFTLPAGTTTSAPIVITQGVKLTTPVNGALEFDGTNLYFSVGGSRYSFNLTLYIAPATIGYFGGGWTTGNYFDKVDKYTFSTDEVSAGQVLTAAKRYVAACNSTTIGYFGGGYTGAELNKVDKYTFATNGVAAGTEITTATWGMAGFESSTIGYFTGGYTSSTYVNTTYKYTFATDGIAAGQVINTARYNPVGCNSLTTGYIGGGRDNSYYFKSVEKYTFATNGVAAGTDLSVERYALFWWRIW